MRNFFKLLFVVALLGWLLAACREATPSLAVTGQTTLVFVYTDG
jgi:hypothetical protein